MSEGVIIRVGLDGTRVTQSLKALKNTIAASTSQMKAEMQIFKNAGDQLGVLSSKFNGLERTIKSQDIQINKLVESYNKAKEKFGENSEQAMKYANQINNATAKQAAFKSQLAATQIELNDFKRGTDKIRSSLSAATSETNALVQRLTAEGKALRANKQEYIGLGTQIQERNRLITSERAKLQELIAEKGLDSEATRNQRIAIMELEATQAGAIASYNRLGKSVGNSSNMSLILRENMNKLKTSIAGAGDALTNAGHSMTMATLGIGAAFVYGIKQATEFQKKMTDIRSLMVSDGESTKEATQITKEMTDQAKRLSNQYGVSAQSIGDAYEMMIRKGDTGKQAMAAVEKMIKASTAAGSDFQETTKVSMNVMEQFFDKTKSSAATAENTTKVTNAMAYAADHGSAKFLELGYSMNYVGDYAKSVGYSMEDMSAYLEVMSRRGVEGTAAGTGLRGVIASLVKPSKQAVGAIKDIGLVTKDSHGNLLRLSDIIEQLREKTANMGTAEKGNLISRIFGRTSLPTVTALMTQTNKQLDDFSAKIKKAESTDYAGTVTKRMMESGQKQLDKFKETLKNFDMDISATMLPSLTEFVQKLNSLMTKFDELSPRTKKIIGEIALGTAIFAPLAIVVGTVFKAISLTISGVTLLGRGLGTLFTLGPRVANKFDRMSLALRGYRTEVNRTTIANEELATSEEATNIAGGGGPSIGSRVSRNSRAIRNTESAVVNGAEGLAESGTLSRGAKFLSGAGKVGKVIGGGIIGLDVLTSATSLIGMNNKNAGSKIGDFAGSLGGGLAGAAIGSLAGPVGTIIGGAIGTYAGSAAGKKLGESLQKQIPNIKDKLSKYNVLDTNLGFSKKIDLATKNALTAYTKLSDEATKKLVEMGITQEAVTKSNVNSLIKPYKKMAQQINNYFDGTEKKSKDTLSKIPGLTQKEQTDILQEVTKGTEEKKKAVDKTEKQIETIYKTAALQHRTTTSSENEEIKKLQDKMNGYAVQSMSTSAEKQKIILGELKDHTGKITAQEAAEAVKNSKKQEDETIKSADNTYTQVKKSAEKKYDSVVSWANNEYYAQGNITKDQYNEMVGNAKKERDDTIKAAKDKRDGAVKQAQDMHDQVIASASDQAGKNADKINWETGQVLTGWDNMYNGVLKGVNWIRSIFDLKALPYKGSVASAYSKSANQPSFSQLHSSGGHAVSSYARGTKNKKHNGGLALVGEEGYELAHIPNKGLTMLGAKGQELVNLPKGSSVLPHNYTKAILKQYGFPAYADGVGDYFKTLLKGPKEAWNLAISKIGLTNNFLPSWMSKWTDYLGTIGTWAKDSLQNMISNLFGKLGSGSGGSSQAQQWIATAMQITGTPMQYLNALMTIAQKESGFNPKAINLTDSNAKAGHPSKGLFQTIDSTFNSFAMPGLGDIYNPVANAVAAIRYMISRYGSITNVPGIKSMLHGGKYVGYASGTKHHKGGPAVLGDGGQQEPYLTPQGQFGISPNVPTLFKNLPAGTKVWASIKDFKSKVGLYAAGTSSNIVPINGTAAIEALMRINQSKEKSDTSKSKNNDSTKMIYLLQQQNQMIQQQNQTLFKMLQSMQGNGSLKGLADGLNKLNGNQYGIKNFMLGQGG